MIGRYFFDGSFFNGFPFEERAGNLPESKEAEERLEGEAEGVEKEEKVFK